LVRYGYFAHRGGNMHTKQQSGFTLVELAVVVFLVGLLASLGLSALNAQLASSRISDTKKKQEIIKDALISYLGKYKRLPCPAISQNGIDVPYGRNSAATAGTWDCKADFGYLPYSDLGLPKSVALDGWENFFSFAVSRQWTLTFKNSPPIAGDTTTNIAGNAFNVGTPGTLTINDRYPATNATPTPISSIAAAIIVSHGKNGLGAFTSKGTQNTPPSLATGDEIKNVPNSTSWAVPPAFYKREYTEIDVPTYGAFDDIVLSLNPSDLITSLMKDGSLKSAESQWAEQITNIKNAVIGYIFSPSNTATCAAPNATQFAALLTAIDIPNQTISGITTFSDPWGYTVTYGTPITKLTNLGVPAPNYLNPYTLTTLNPNITTINTPLISTFIASYPTFLGNCPL